VSEDATVEYISIAKLDAQIADALRRYPDFPQLRAEADCSCCVPYSDAITSRGRDCQRAYNDYETALFLLCVPRPKEVK